MVFRMEQVCSLAMLLVKRKRTQPESASVDWFGMAVTVEMHNTGDSVLRSEIIALVEHVLFGLEIGGCRLLARPTRNVRELLELTNLASVFKVLSPEDTAPRHPVAITDDTAAYQCD